MAVSWWWGRTPRQAVLVKAAAFTPRTPDVRLYLGVLANLEPCPHPGGRQLSGWPRALRPTWVPASLESFLLPLVRLISGQVRGSQKQPVPGTREAQGAAAAAQREGFQWEAETERQRWRVKIARAGFPQQHRPPLSSTRHRAHEPRAAPRPTSLHTWHLKGSCPWRHPVSPGR